MSSISKRPNGRYRARYRDAEGREHAQHFAKKTGKGGAQEWLDRMTASVVRGDHVDAKAGRITFEEYARAWLSTKTVAARSTRANIEGRLNKWAIPYFGKMRVAAVRPMHARGFVAHLVTSGLAPSTVKGDRAHYGPSVPAGGRRCDDRPVTVCTG